MKIKNSKKKLSHEISAVLLLKVILLFIVWYVCFSAPIDDHNVKKMSQEVSTHFFGAPSSTQNKVSQHD